MHTYTHIHTFQDKGSYSLTCTRAFEPENALCEERCENPALQCGRRCPDIKAASDKTAQETLICEIPVLGGVQVCVCM